MKAIILIAIIAIFGLSSCETKKENLSKDDYVKGFDSLVFTESNGEVHVYYMAETLQISMSIEFFTGFYSFTVNEVRGFLKAEDYSRPVLKNKFKEIYIGEAKNILDEVGFRFLEITIHDDDKHSNEKFIYKIKII